MIRMMGRRIIYMLFTLLFLHAETALGQLGFDVATLEAYIADHKTQRSLLLARSTLEQSNKLLHDYSQVANKEYKEINVELDKYSRAFDIIDILVNSLHTAFNVKDTYDEISTKLGKYRTMLNRFNDKCLERGNIYSTDTLLITVNAAMIVKIAEEGDNLLRSLTALVGYATGAAACSITDLSLILSSINLSLDNIKRYLNAGYSETWRYIMLRTGLWKPVVYKAKPLPELLEGAFEKWMENAHIWSY